jgi:hypothetical protein
LNATCPDGRQISLDTYENCQADTLWTGIGYTIAALALSVGLQKISDVIMDSTHDNQLRCGRLWDHEECGPHYTRPLSSWTTLIAAGGLEVDASAKTIRMTPCKDGITIPFCTCDHLGTVQFNGDECEIALTEGTLEGWTVQVCNREDTCKVHIRHS